MFSKIGQELSIKVIISAVMALIVLIVLIAMLTGKLGAFGKGADEADELAKTCEKQGGEIKTKSLGCGNKELVIASDTLVVGKICCKSTVYSLCIGGCKADLQMCDQFGAIGGVDCDSNYNTCTSDCTNR
jgi:hypothetical protein